MIKRVVAGQRGGGCEIRTREGLPPTRFPTMHPRSPASATIRDLPERDRGGRW